MIRALLRPRAARADLLFPHVGRVDDEGIGRVRHDLGVETNHEPPARRAGDGDGCIPGCLLGAAIPCGVLCELQFEASRLVPIP